MVNYEIVNYPPEGIYERAKEKWGVSFDNIIFANGDKIHTKYKLSFDLIAHEEVHLRQQKEMGLDEWWNMYFENENFRLTQEIEAYQEQYRSVCLNTKDRNERARSLFHMANAISGSNYGSMIHYSDGLQLIRNNL